MKRDIVSNRLRLHSMLVAEDWLSGNDNLLSGVQALAYRYSLISFVFPK